MSSTTWVCTLPQIRSSRTRLNAGDNWSAPPSSRPNANCFTHRKFIVDRCCNNFKAADFPSDAENSAQISRSAWNSAKTSFSLSPLRAASILWGHPSKYSMRNALWETKLKTICPYKSAFSHSMSMESSDSSSSTTPRRRPSGGCSKNPASVKLEGQQSIFTNSLRCRPRPPLTWSSSQERVDSTSLSVLFWCEW